MIVPNDGSKDEQSVPFGVDQNTMIESIKQCASQEDLTKILQRVAIARSSTNNDNHIDDDDETIASYLIRNIVVFSDESPVHSALHGALNRLDPVATLSACSQVLVDASKGTDNTNKTPHDMHHPEHDDVTSIVIRTPIPLQTALWHIRQRYLNNNNDNDNKAQLDRGGFGPVAKLFREENDKSAMLGEAFVDGVVASLFRIPVLTANACQGQRVVFPEWANRARFVTSLVMVALGLVSDDPDEAGFVLYLQAIFRRGLQAGTHDALAVALLQRFNDHEGEASNNSSRMSLVRIFQMAMSGVRSPRDKVFLLRSMLQHSLTIHVARTNNKGSTASLGGLPSQMKRFVVPVLDSSESIRERWFQLTVLSVSSVSDDGVADSKFCRAVAETLALCSTDASNSDDSDDSDASDSDDNNEPLSFPQAVLRRYITKAARVWAERTFVQRTDRTLQQHVSFFLLAALGTLHRREGKGTAPFVAPLLNGTTIRLESSIFSIRRQGMEVGEALAERLGQALHFDELDVVRKQEQKDDTNKTTPVKPTAAKTKSKTTRNKNKTTVIDPDAAYVSSSSDGDSVEDDGASIASSDSDNSLFGTDDRWKALPRLSWTVQDDDDDEEDLQTTAKPLYLRDCLDLLRTPETDELAPSHHETALAAVEELIRSHPLDLHDVAVDLARQLLYMENKFGMDGFAQQRVKGLIALVVEEPVVAGAFAIESVFRSGSLHNRTDALAALEQAGLELCGMKNLSWMKRLDDNEKDRTVADSGNVTTVLDPKHKGTDKTRRWRTARAEIERKEQGRRIQNEFAGIAAPWFYALLSRFAEKKDDTALWAGANGTRLLSRLLHTLSCIVECSGQSPGTDTLASDLAGFAWSFHTTDSSELRSSVLLSVYIGFSRMRPEAIATALFGGGGVLRDLPDELRRTILDDSNPECREFAKQILSSCHETLSLLGEEPRGISAQR